MSDSARIWILIAVVSIGTYLIRYSFIGLVGDRALPPWAARMLRYVPVAVMPGLVAPLIAWPQATGGVTDPARLAAAVAALIIGITTRNVLASIFGGMAVLYLALWLIG
ncbi:branched-subunit amino acid transport protein [Amaricoccus macauensis]|uniref:Branched-subunit amino acid transport protein n=1 Tax=Amaricoccus macauensis TaxID=57001 RepID=A0A840SNS2_9RHOB|nr:AzlD domain-containing protein [Amaricoccus macauensis]MBB5220952.1 branched-subunit amino acid transport protein [Amaricoccus macauensis]